MVNFPVEWRRSRRARGVAGSHCPRPVCLQVDRARSAGCAPYAQPAGRTVAPSRRARPLRSRHLRAHDKNKLPPTYTAYLADIKTGVGRIRPSPGPQNVKMIIHLQTRSHCNEILDKSSNIELKASPSKQDHRCDIIRRQQVPIPGDGASREVECNEAIGVAGHTQGAVCEESQPPRRATCRIRIRIQSRKMHGPSFIFLNGIMQR
ncbi:hypothetical protein MSG28_000911 [Choristoneura fumiferana]|uniref:Uncharacterized protein n=1 Tax=Choristoneura fumiferana TaxID=7141 RepID=A0ACC0K385_CHOFU|nr:hypothetical protein MSG28_000911 [Choristoneura fumiferana]